MIKCILLLLLVASPCWALEQTTVDKVDSLYPWYISTVATNWTTSGCTAGQEWDCLNEYGSVSDEDATHLAITNAVGADIDAFRSNPWLPLGLQEIDSVYLHLWAMKTGGTAGAVQFCIIIDGTEFFTFDATGTLPTTTYTHYEGDQVQNPNTASDWTLADINEIQWGFDRSTNPSAAQAIHVSQVFLEIFWKQNKQADTIDATTELFDTYMASAAHTNKNFGSANFISCGRATSAYTARPMYFLDTAFWTNWHNYYIDSAYLDIKTSHMFGGTHYVVGHTVIWGAIPGTVNGTAQNGSVCWNYARYHSEADAWRDWSADGADSTVDDGGNDRWSFGMDSVLATTDETVYTLNITEWANVACGFDWVRHYGYANHYDIGWLFPTLPIQLRLMQSSEALPDTQIAFYSMEDATSTNRPRIRIWGTHR